MQCWDCEDSGASLAVRNLQGTIGSAPSDGERRFLCEGRQTKLRPMPSAWVWQAGRSKAFQTQKRFPAKSGRQCPAAAK